MNVIGLDIGTTSICAAVFDADSGVSVETLSIDNNFSVAGKPYERCQDAEAIFSACREKLNELIDRHLPVCSIGITGQMHGIVYLDKSGKAISRLYTWQDMSGAELSDSGISFSEQLSSITGYHCSPGFGLATYYTHKSKNEVPLGAECICTVHDYAAMRLCGSNRPVMHSSDGASFGLFDFKNMSFDCAAVGKAGLDASILPHVTDTFDIVGYYRDIPVCVAVGDNQASFIGSVSDTENSLLVNIGTGSQISYLAKCETDAPCTELRPCGCGRLIRVGSALCGGRAFAALEQFLRESANMAGAGIISAYPFMDRYLAACCEPKNPLEVSTRFAGTRINPDERGKIENISLDNFTPGHLIYGVLSGIANELYSMYNAAGETGHRFLVGSGNGLRKNTALQIILERTFGCELRIPNNSEEAAFGAALCSLTASGRYDAISDAQKLIKYQ